MYKNKYKNTQSFKCIGKIKTKSSKDKVEFKKRLKLCHFLQNCEKIDGYFVIEINAFLNDILNRDLDNIVKIILDSLKNVAYIDDRFCLGIDGKKFETNNNEEFLEINITPMPYKGVV